MARSVVLVPFGWYPNGHTYEALDVGAERDFGSSTDGLKAANLIGDLPVDGEVPVLTAQPAQEPAAEDAPLPSTPEPELAAGEAPAAVDPTVDSDPVLPRRRARK